MAEALIREQGGTRIYVESAGSHPASRVHPLAVERLAAAGISWRGRHPRGLDRVASARWDLVITVCDNAREHCPILPGQPLRAHWGMPDPAEVEGDEAARRHGFDQAFETLRRRIDLLLALPLQSMTGSDLAQRVSAIAEA